MVRTFVGIFVETTIHVVAVVGVRIEMTIVMAQVAMLQTVIYATNPIIPLLIAPTSTANDAVTGAMGCTVVIDVTTQYVV